MGSWTRCSLAQLLQNSDVWMFLCFCSCLWVPVSMSPYVHITHTSWNFLHISLMRIEVFEMYAIGRVLSKPLIMACGNGLNLYQWDSKELICFRHCIVWTGFTVFLRTNWYVTEELGSQLSAAKSEVLVQMLPLQLHGLVPALLFIRGIAETAQLAKLADHHFLTRLAFAGLASWVISMKDQEWAAKVQKGLVWISLDCAEWQPLRLP